MAGQPFFHALSRKIDALGGLEFVLDRVADGESLRRVADRIGCSRAYVEKWLRADPERYAAWREAKRIGAGAKFDEAEEIIDDAAGALSPVQVQAATARAKHKVYMAGVMDREEYGENPKSQVNVNISAGELHLDALRARVPARPERQVLTGTPVE